MVFSRASVTDQELLVFGDTVISDKCNEPLFL